MGCDQKRADICKDGFADLYGVGCGREVSNGDLTEIGRERRMCPDLATTETGPDCALSASTASFERAGVGTIGGAAAKGLSPWCAAGGKKFKKFGSSQAGLKAPSNGSCVSGANLDIA